LPGDPRGSVASVRSGPGPRREHDHPGTPIDDGMPGLHAASRERLAGEPVYLTPEQALAVSSQFHETAKVRGGRLLALAVMANHTHLVVGVPGDPEPDTLVRDLKSYGSRALNRTWGKPPGGTWWTSGGGSRRKLPDEQAVRAAIGYVRNQARPLVTWIDPE